MKRKLSDALNEIRDPYIAEATNLKKRVKPVWLKIMVAAAVLVLILTIFGQPLSLSAAAVSQADYPKHERLAIDRNDVGMMEEFFHQAIEGTLSGLDGENGAFSPVNLMMGLSALAELTDGEARQQILTTLNAPDMDALRSRANTVWRASYLDDGNQLMLANSLWLDKSVDFNPDVMDALSQHYYTSSYRGDLGSRKTNRLIAQWLDSQTGNMLKSDTANIQVPKETILALYSTIYFQAKWSNEFNARNNEDGIFHSPNGDQTVTFMNKEKMQGEYFWAEDFGAIQMYLKGGSTMWLFLPDEGKTVEDILSSQDYMDMMAWRNENHKYLYINLSIPKFDIRQNCDLKNCLEDMGITDVFDRSANAFANSVYSSKFGEGCWLTAANQTTRVAIDEKGVTAASYIEFPGAGAAAPPEDEVDFVLDRPFVFVIVHKGVLPIFAGVVNEP
jgi:serine protease inhibitor